MPRPRLLLACLLVGGLAVGLRFAGLGYMLPSLVEPDAHIPVQVELLERGDPQPERTLDYGKYPLLVAWTTLAVTPRPAWGTLPAEAPLEEHLALAAAPIRRVRWAVALLSLLALPATWILARLYLPRGGALVAVAFVATSLLAVHFAAQARPHGAAIGFSAMAVVTCLLVRRRARWSDYACAGIACALAFGALQSGVAVAIPLGVAHLLAWRGRGLRHHLKLVVPAAAYAVALVAFYPFWLSGGEAGAGGQVAVQGTTLDQAGHKLMLNLFNGRGFALLGRAFWSWEPALCLGSLLALAVWLADRLRRRPATSGLPFADQLVVLSFVLPYSFVIGLYQRSYERFLIPLLPFLAVAAAWGLWRMARASGSAGRPARVAVGLAVGLLLAFPALVASRLASARTAPDTYQLAAAWVAGQTAPGRDGLATNPPLVLPLYRSPESLASERFPRKGRLGRGLVWFGYQRDVLGGRRGGPAWDVRWMPVVRPEWRQQVLAWPREFVRSLQAEYAVVEVFEQGRIHPVGKGIRDALREHAELVARFSPDRDPLAFDTPLVYQDETGGTVPLFALRLLGARATGAVLEVYRLPGTVPRGG